MKFEKCPTTLKRICRAAEKDFRTNGFYRAAVRARFPGESHISYTDVNAAMRDAQTKEAIIHVMKMAAQMGAECVALVSEVFTVEPKNDLDLRIAKDGDLHRHPRRKEVLMVNYQEPGLNFLAFAPIERRPIGIGEWEIQKWTAEEQNEQCKATNIDPNKVRFQNIFEKAGR